ncbi:MAG: hypothetical protein ABSG68_01430 [Thermoguttaceae bacterium]|jgi:hypothetical protein
MVNRKNGSATAGFVLLHCPNCASPLRLTRQLHGRHVRCLECGTVLMVKAEANGRAGSGKITATPVAVMRPCPQCAHDLFLVPELNGARIRCKGCLGVFDVAAPPWTLSPLTPGKSTAANGTPALPPAPPAQRVGYTPGRPKKSASDAARSALEMFRPAADSEDSEPQPEKAGEEIDACDNAGEDQASEQHEPPAKPVEPIAPSAHQPAHVSRAPSRQLKVAVAPAVKMAGATLLLLALLGGGWWLFFSGPRVHPQVRYLPEQCDLFLSMNWRELQRSGVEQAPQGLPGTMLVERCRRFLANAGLEAEDIERINAGRAAGGSGIVVVYRLTHAIQPEQIMNKPLFRAEQKSTQTSETVCGTALYLFEVSAIAFPDPRTIVNGDTQLLRRVLTRGKAGLGEPLRRFVVKELDFTAANVAAMPGLPQPLSEAYLRDHADLAQSVCATTDRFAYGPSGLFVRTFHMADEAAAIELQQALTSSLAVAGQNAKTPPEVRQICESLRVSVWESKVTMRLTMPSSPLSDPARACLNQLFSSLQ